VNYKKVGLGSYGKEGSYYARQVSHNGFAPVCIHSLFVARQGALMELCNVRRQVATWTRQYRASATEEVPAIESLITWLSANVPEERSGDCTIVHGDMKFDNGTICAHISCTTTGRFIMG
jgi:hypothetical protein